MILSFQESVTGITISPKKSFCILRLWMSTLTFQNPRVITDISGLSVSGCILRSINLLHIDTKS